MTVTEGVRIHFGKHKGELYTRLPVSYLKWMINERVKESGMAAAELRRRGTVTPDLDVSGHAVDRASLRCRKCWYETRRDDNEGLHAWLCRMAAEARIEGLRDEQGRYRYSGMVFAFQEDGVWPVLKTVFPDNRKEADA